MVRESEVDAYDVIVVGAGTTGSVLAARLSENPSRRVLLLEAGEVYDRLDQIPESVLDPSNMTNSMPGSPTNWAMPGTLLNDFRLPVPRGKIMGGSGSINGAYFVRGTRSDFDGWAKLGNDAWSYDQVLPFFKRSESDRDFSGEAHGQDGPVPVHREAPDRAPEFAAAFTAACLDLGFHEEPDKNSGDRGGVGPIPMNIEGGRRQSTAITYLLPAMPRANLEVRGRVRVLRLLFEDSRCVGVEADVAGKRQTFRAAETVLAMGALRTPQILMLSGIGPSDHLREHGIAVRQHLSGVGLNLTDHPELSVRWDYAGKFVPMPGRGVLTNGLNWTSELGSEVDDLEIMPFMATSREMMKVASMAKRPLKSLAAVRQSSLRFLLDQARALSRPFVVIGLQKEDSRGTVRLRSSDPLDHPDLNWNLLAEESDRRRLREAVRTTVEIFESAPMRSIQGRVIGLGPENIRTDRSTDEWMLKHIFAVGHACGTCRMGPESDSEAVVDQYGRVYGVSGLRIADTSIFPSIPARGPNATAVMAGERLSEFFQ